MPKLYMVPTTSFGITVEPLQVGDNRAHRHPFPPK